MASSDDPAPLTLNVRTLRWKTALPGAGSSSPVVFGDKVFITCFTGAEDAAVVRHLLCLDRSTGKVLWKDAVAAGREDDYRGYLTEHGYASSTPAADADAVYAFFGKSGVHAWGHDGKKLWKADVGSRSDPKGWGSGAAVTLYKDLVIVNASSESRSLRALDRRTGKEVWKAAASGLALAFGTPVVVEDVIVLAVPGELWGLNAATGKLRWYASIAPDGNVAPSVAGGGGLVFAIGGYTGKGTVAVRPGGKGDVTRSHVVWTIRPSSYVPSPVYHDGRLHWIDDEGMAMCVEAATGRTLYRERLPIRGGSGKPVYASLVRAGGHFYAVTRRGGVFVFPVGPKFELTERNAALDDSAFNATSAVADGQLFVRSEKFLYCFHGK
jgi:outer membrane protein assembly factor BamB